VPVFPRAGATGLEPATSGVTGRRSNQLSYAPEGSCQYDKRKSFSPSATLGLVEVIKRTESILNAAPNPAMGATLRSHRTRICSLGPRSV
jgi:hypothetical protein